MNIVDSSEWLEYFADGPIAAILVCLSIQTCQVLETRQVLLH